MKKIKNDHQEKLVKDIKIFLKKKKKKSSIMFVNVGNFSEIEKNKLVEYRKKYCKMRKAFHYNYKKLF